MVQEIDPTEKPRTVQQIGLMIAGFILLIIACWLVFWNEGVSLSGMSHEKLNGYVIYPIPSSPADFKNNNKLVYLTGMLVSNSVLEDPLLGYSDKAIKIERKIEMYQWTQTEESKKEKLTDGSEREIVTYVYKPVWSKDLIDSNGFKDAVAHQNPVSMPLNALKGQSQDVTVGDFHLSEELIAQIPGAVPVDLSNLDVTNIQQNTKQSVQHDGHTIFIGNNIHSPSIGDVRISLFKVIPQKVSIIAQQTDNALHPLITSGHPIAVLKLGTLTLKDMLQQGKSSTSGLHWMIRGGIFVIMLIAMYLIIKSGSAILSTLNHALRHGILLPSFLLALAVWTITLSFAWFIIQPFWAIVLLILVLTFYFLVFSFFRRKARQ